MADIKRLNYFTYQFLVEKDFDDEQDYHLQMRRRHNRSMHTPGVAIGMEVTRTGAGNQVRIAAGTAIDRDGREIVLDDARVYTLVTSGNDQDVFLTIAYHEEFDPADHSTEGGVNEFKRTMERPQLQDSATAPPTDGSVILLARIRLNGQSQIDSDAAINSAVRTQASAKLAVQGANTVTVVTDAASKKITIGETHSARVDNPHATTAAQIDAQGGANRIVTQINAGTGVIARTRVEPAVVSGVVTFASLLPNVESFSNDIDPGFGAGAVGVELALEDAPAANQTLAGDSGYGRAIQYRAVVNRANGTFRILALRAAGQPAGQARVRWFACKPSAGADATVVVDVSVNPPTAGIANNQQVNLTASTGNVTNSAVSWSVSDGTFGTLSALTNSSATFTSGIKSGTVQVTATSVADPSKFKSCNVSINAPIVVQISQQSANLLTGKQLTLTADVLNTTDKGINWSITPTGAGSLSAATGATTTFTASGNAGPVTVKATSTVDNQKSASCAVNVALLTVTVTADATTINVNTATTVRAAITPAFADNRVTWEVTGGGSANPTTASTTTAYTAPNSNGTRTVKGTSVADTSKSHSVNIAVVGASPPPPPPPPPPPGKEFLDIVGENVSLGDGKQARTFLQPKKRTATRPPEEPKK